MAEKWAIEREDRMGLSIVPLLPTRGAEVRGVDLGVPQDAAIAAAFDKYIVFVFREQNFRKPITCGLQATSAKSPCAPARSATSPASVIETADLHHPSGYWPQIAVY
jgi:hypothetical protein